MDKPKTFNPRAGVKRSRLSVTKAVLAASKSFGNRKPPPITLAKSVKEGT